MGERGTGAGGRVRVCCGCSRGAPGMQSAAGGSREPGQALANPAGLSAAQIPLGFLAGICSAQALSDSGSINTATTARGRCPGGVPGPPQPWVCSHTWGTAGPVLTQEQSECQDIHGQPRALPGGTKMMLQRGHSCRGLSQLWHSHTPRGAGGRQHPPPPLAAPTGLRGAAPPSQTPHGQCRAPSHSPRQRPSPSLCPAPAPLSPEGLRDTWGQEPAAPEQAGQGHPCSWPGSRC